jgi:hypothetical protein
MPSLYDVKEIVKTARKKDRGGGASEDDWNTEVHLQLLKLALKTSKWKETLDIHNVYVLYLRTISNKSGIFLT